MLIYEVDPDIRTHCGHMRIPINPYEDMHRIACAHWGRTYVMGMVVHHHPSGDGWYGCLQTTGSPQREMDREPEEWAARQATTTHSADISAIRESQ